MSFAKIAGLPADQKDDILDNKIKASEREKYDEWELQMANQEADKASVRKELAYQRISTKKEIEQMEYQEEKKLDGNIQVAIEKVNKQVPEIVQKMEMILER